MSKTQLPGNNCRWFQIGGITIQVEADRPITSQTFAPKFGDFAVDGPGSDTIFIHHRFGLPDLQGRNLGRMVYQKMPWAVFEHPDAWFYLGSVGDRDNPQLTRFAEFNRDHTQGTIYSPNDKYLLKGGLQSLTTFVTDQIVLARVLADRRACYLHSAAVIVEGAGLLFVGHSEAGKSTIAGLLDGRSQLLCDDRNIVRRWPDGFRVHGTWSHGEIPRVSAASAPLAAIFLLTKAEENRLVKVADRVRLATVLAACMIRPVLDAGWWEKSLNLVESMMNEIPCYEMRFDKSGAIVPALLELVRSFPPTTRTEPVP
jgi:hypothetical protein